MAARQQFQQGTRASQIGLGTGEAQVAQKSGPRGNIAGDIRQARAMEQKKKKAKEDELKIDDAGDVLPIYQTLLGKENASLYEWGREHQDDADFDIKWNQKKMEHGAKIAEAREESKRFRTLQGKYDPNKNYNEDSMRSAELSMNYDAVLDEQGNLAFDWEEGSDVVKDANKGYSQGYSSKGFKEVADIMRPQVNFSKEKGKFEFINDKGEQIMTSTEDFTEDQARNLILNNMKTMDNDFYQSGLSQMDDSDKKKFGEDMNGVAEWYADEYADEFVQQYKSQTITPGKESGPGWKSNKYQFAHGVGVDKRSEKGEGPKGEEVEKDVEYDEIRMERTDVSENKNIFITNPRQGEKNQDTKIWATPISVKRKKGTDEWLLVYEEFVPKLNEEGKEIEGKGKLEQRVMPWSEAQEDIKANYGGFDPDTYMKEVVGEEESTEKEPTKEEEASYSDAEESGISRVMEANGVSREEAIKALKDAGKIK